MVVAATVLTEFSLSWLKRNTTRLADHDIQTIAARLSDLLADERLADLFGPGSQAETGIAGTVTIAGRKLRINGKIDRLAVKPGRIIIADYKTNRLVPATPAEVPEVYVAQLALYRQLLAEMEPDTKIECLLVWTESGTISMLDDAAMDRAVAEITPD
jgi:ATP-dependent helicase/nuclease subunit A